ncbi:hypothetical protein P175DRAFT_0499295 [Aspergillus ochraceoroseus IBT 24754]|uniref:Pre-rRNA-processing protein ESF2 n=3 Tax=Aspergillus subgen. Nidulantes TaxID=2720870 RepID=A0A0F8UM33_9EURO|nr:uncharacterized protein P175DRAFT_0499295 [Aspergillus ochraceoroseus IBT 24754]KKK20036.1 hypothetical protein AOCH_002309 [Aspergillus ochraceoroseus]KKK20583.1 hypothetical protein ARAM_004045 [Aspergillus rambellii]PTU22749.1 hypothetical protein P175DRAFT_0499295 [Aspergillus ochraceoroseus IBT 24754]
MTTRTHNEFLEIAPSDDDEATDRGYDSEEKVTESKGRAVKRRRTVDTQDFFGLQSDEEDSDSEDEDKESPSDIQGKGRKSAKTKPEPVADEEDNDDDDDDDDDGNDNDKEGDMLLDATANPSEKKTAPKIKPLSTNKPLKAPKKNKTGVIYLSSLPPYLKCGALKSFLEARGFKPITRAFLTPLVLRDTRKRSNKRKMYTDGWVEFASKKTAKICAETLNATIIGGRKGGWYHDDIWNMKYLRGFKWADLMEQVQRERSEREAKRRIEDTRARKEEKVFLEGVEAGRVADGMARKNEEKRRRLAKDTDGDVDIPAKVPQAMRRTFVQNDVIRAKGDRGDLQKDATRVLAKIF